LASAKTNLERLAYFGLTEEQHLSQYLFQQTFQLEFRVPFQQFNTTHSSLTTQGRLNRVAVQCLVYKTF
jgi:heparan sulfate 6-O-sulfotransferase HS6ST1